MIVDQLKNAALYKFDKKLARALDYLAKTDFSKLPTGKVVIDGAEMFALVQNYETRLREKCRFEAHRKYIDVQYVVEGTEQMGYAHVAALQSAAPHDAEKDAEMFTGEGSFIAAPAGTFLIFFPEDGHMPGVAIGKPKPVRKVVLKVKV